jgi:hypothetical protein
LITYENYTKMHGQKNKKSRSGYFCCRNDWRNKHWNHYALSRNVNFPRWGDQTAWVSSVGKCLDSGKSAWRIFSDEMNCCTIWNGNFYAQNPCWRTTLFQLFATAYSVYSQPPSISAGLRPHPEDAPCRGGSDPCNTVTENSCRMWRFRSVMATAIKIQVQCCLSDIFDVYEETDVYIFRTYAIQPCSTTA